MDSQTYKYPNIPEVKIVILLGEPQNICCDRAKKILTNKKSMKFSIPELNILYYYFGEFKIIDNGFTDLYN